MSCSLSRVTCHVSARHIFTWRVSPTNCGHPSARRQFPQQRNSSQQQRICSGCAVVQAPHRTTCSDSLSRAQPVVMSWPNCSGLAVQKYTFWCSNYNSCKIKISLHIMHMHKRVYAAPSCRSMTFSAPLCCSVVQDTRAVHPHTTTTTTTAMIPALCASCRGKGWRLFSPLALTLAESWCTLHASSWYF